METLISKIEKSLTLLIKDNSKILVALSGGKDSVALLNILLELRDKINITLCCAYINHNLRGDESIGEETFVKDYCKNLGVELFTLSVPNDYWNKIGKDSIEMAARSLRYSFFKKISKEQKINYVALAHHLNDKIETFFLQILRTGGLETLSSIPIKNGKIIRPLLNITRKEIEHYIIENKLPFIEDSTNSQNIYKRNIIRNKLVPVLKEINPSFEKSISNLFNLIEDESYFIQKLSSSSYKEIVITENTSFVCINKSDYQNLQIVIQKYILKKILKKLNYPTKPNKILLKSLSGKSSLYIYKKNDLYVKSMGNYIWFVNRRNINGLNKDIIIKECPFKGKIKNSVITITKDLITNGKDKFCFNENTHFPVKIKNLSDSDKINIGDNINKKVIKVLKDNKIPSILFQKIMIFEDNNNNTIGYYLSKDFFRVNKDFYIDNYQIPNLVFGYKI